MLNYETLSLPTPFPVGNVNCYLIKNDPVTLIDCGLNSLESLKALKEQLKGFGFEIKDIKQILITHAHPDHYGLASTLQMESGAKVFMHKDEIGKAKDRTTHLNRIVEYLAFYGLPQDLRSQLSEYFNWELSFVRPLEVVVGIEDGNNFLFENAELQAVLTPGHAVGHLCFYEKNAGLLFSGDTILRNITPNPVLEPSPNKPYFRDQSLIKYIDSLRRLKALPLNLILTGHGGKIINIADQFLRVSTHHQNRKDQINKILMGRKQFTPYDIACELWPNFKRSVDMYLAISEVLGYLDVLNTEGEIRQVETPSGLLISHI